MYKHNKYLRNGICPQCGAGRFYDCTGQYELCLGMEDGSYAVETINCPYDTFGDFRPHQHCMACGCTIWEAFPPDVENPDEKYISFRIGFGVCFLRTVEGSYFCPLIIHLGEELIKDVQERLNDPEVIAADCYLTIWNDDEKRVEVIFGEENVPKAKIDNPRDLTDSLD